MNKNMAEFHQGPRPETLARVATDGIGYEIAVQEGAPSGVAAILVKLELSAQRAFIPTQLRLLFRSYAEAPVCALRLDCYDPWDEGEGNLEDSELVQGLLSRRPVLLETLPIEPIMTYHLLFDPREEGSRYLLAALATAGSYIVEFYDRDMTPRLTKRFSLQTAFNTTAQQILDCTQLIVPDEAALGAWQVAKEHFLQDLKVREERYDRHE
jgi:hypothetical protein